MNKRHPERGGWATPTHVPSLRMILSAYRSTGGMLRAAIRPGKMSMEGVKLMFNRSIALTLALGLAMVACEKEETPATPQRATHPKIKVAAQPTAITEGLQTPESVYYDADQDVYFISNINGAPLDADDNGYISRVNAETMKAEAKWIDGTKPEITLNAPKGMAVVGDDLYVADINTVRKFDRKTGAPKGEIPLKGSTFLNDVVADGTTVYVSDSGLKADPKGFAPTGTDAIWKITGDKASKLVAGASLKAPNGLAISGGKLWVVTFGGNELYQIESGKKAKVVTTLPKGSLDGLVAMSDGSFLVSSWDGKAVYRGRPGETFTAVIENVDSPADIGYDTKRHRLLVPHFMESRVTIHPLQ
jgi:sugar lactone lactonase YvrE